MTSITNDVTQKTGRRPLTPWELPSLLAPLHEHRRSNRKAIVVRPHFPAILTFVYRNRFAVRSQVQTRFADVLRSERTGQRHLEELQSLGYLDLVPARGIGAVFPKVFFVTGRGVRKIEKSLAEQGKAWTAVRVDRRGQRTDEGYSADQVVHEILITEFLSAAWQTVRSRLDLEVPVVERRSLNGHSAFEVSVAGRRSRLIPDAMFLFRQTGGGMICCFIEMDTGSMNPKQIEMKYRRYEAWSRSAAGQEYLLDLYRRSGATKPRPVFRVLMIGKNRTGNDDARRLAELQKAAHVLPADLRNRLWFTTVASLREHQHDAAPLDCPIWETGADLMLDGQAEKSDAPVLRHLFPKES